jgi:hypothetical protein
VISHHKCHQTEGGTNNNSRSDGFDFVPRSRILPRGTSSRRCWSARRRHSGLPPCRATETQKGWFRRHVLHRLQRLLQSPSDQEPPTVRTTVVPDGADNPSVISHRARNSISNLYSPETLDDVECRCNSKTGSAASPGAEGGPKALAVLASFYDRRRQSMTLRYPSSSGQEGIVICHLHYADGSMYISSSVNYQHPRKGHDVRSDTTRDFSRSATS